MVKKIIVAINRIATMMKIFLLVGIKALFEPKRWILIVLEFCFSKMGKVLFFSVPLSEQLAFFFNALLIILQVAFQLKPNGVIE